MLQVSETVFMKSRAGKNGTYESGWILNSTLRNLLDAADKAGLQAMGVGGIRDIKTTKFAGKIIKLTPFALKPQK